MIILLFIGHLAELLFQLGDNDYPGFVRVAQMAAYPMLLLLPQRSQTAVTTQTQLIKQPPQERRLYNIDPQIIESFLALASAISPIETCKIICRAVSQSILADLCLLITPPGAEGNMSILCGYDLIREIPIGGTSIESENIPHLAASIRGRKPLRQPASTTSVDLAGLCQALELPNNGSLLAPPITIPGQDAPLGTVLVSLYSRREWTDDDQTYLLEINTFITQLLQHSAQVEVLETQLADSRREFENLQTRQGELQTQTSLGLSQTANIAALVSTHEEAQATIERLEAELETLRETTQIASSDKSLTPQEIDIIEGELGLTLEEATHLRSALAEADQKIHSLEQSLSTSIYSDEQAERAATIVQELRQPLSSILGYTELLLSESVGILGALQRKFIDRIKSSSERMGTLIEELTSLDPVHGGDFGVASKPLDLSSVVIEAITHAEAAMQAKNITLNLKVPKQMPQLFADRDAIVQVLIHLLQNAAAASPEDSETSLRAQVIEGEEYLDYVLIQVSDMGEGIPVDDLPRVFSSLYRADGADIQGIGHTDVDLSIVKTLVEIHNGRIWVESEQGKGSTFSILLPVSTTAASTPGKVEENVTRER
jgi:signal transduction histidine kinase